MKTLSQNEALLELIRKSPLIRAGDLREAGIPSSVVSRAVRKGLIERVSRGVYRHPDNSWDENFSLSEVAAKVPQGIIVLVSALNFHQIGTHQAHSVWIQLKNNAVTPKIDYPSIAVVRTGVARAFSEGVETHELNGIRVPITTPARTVADCFKHRSKLGLDLCLEALREIVPSRATSDEVLSFARMNRVENVMVPYLEAIT